MVKFFYKIIKSDGGQKLVANFFSLAVLRGFQFLIPLVTLPYLVSVLGMDNFGLINFALSLGLYFGAIIQFGFGITATREISRNRDNLENLEKIYSNTIGASIILVLISAILFISVVVVFDKFNSHLSLYIFTLIFIIFRSLFPVWFFQGMENMKYITVLNLITNIIFLLTLFVFVKKEADFTLVPLLNAIAAIITFLLSLILIKKQFHVCFVKPKWVEIKETFRSGKDAFVSQLAPNLYNNSAVFILGVFANNSSVGLYTAATKVIDAVISFGYILSNTFLPYLSRNISKHKLFQKVMIVSGLILTILTFLSSGLISELLFAVNNLEISLYIKALSISIFSVFITLMYGANFFMITGKDYVVKNITLYTSIAFFIFTLIMIPILGIWGAIATLIGARLSMALAHYVCYLKFVKLGSTN